MFLNNPQLKSKQILEDFFKLLKSSSVSPYKPRLVLHAPGSNCDNIVFHLNILELRWRNYVLQKSFKVSFFFSLFYYFNLLSQAFLNSSYIYCIRSDGF